MLLIIFFLLHEYIVTHFRRKKILWHQVYNKPIFVPKEFLQTHSPERVVHRNNAGFKNPVCSSKYIGDRDLFIGVYQKRGIKYLHITPQ